MRHKWGCLSYTATASTRTPRFSRVCTQGGGVCGGGGGLRLDGVFPERPSELTRQLQRATAEIEMLPGRAHINAGWR